MLDVQTALNEIMKLNGAIGAALVDFDSGMCLGTAGGGTLNLGLAAAGNVEVVRAKKNVRDELGLPDKIEDILITLDTQYHLIRMLHDNTKAFLYIVLNRDKANLAMARFQLKKIDQELKI